MNSFCFYLVKNDDKERSIKNNVKCMAKLKFKLKFNIEVYHRSPGIHNVLFLSVSCF